MDFDAVYQENAEIVYCYLFALTQDAHLAEDLTQQVFYEALRAPHRYRGDAALSTYLCGIAKNLLRKEWQRQARRREIPLEDAAEVPSLTDIEGQVVDTVTAQALQRKIDALPELPGAVVRLRLSGELSFAQIGEILGKSETWARVTFYRAKQALMKGEDA